MSVKLVFAILAIAAISVPSSHAQAPAQKPMFELAGIRPVKANSVRSGGSCHGKDSKFSSEQPHLISPPPIGRCAFKAVTLHDLVRFAYVFELQDGMDDLIANEPSWMKSELFDVDAVAPSPETTTGRELQAMLQTLLADRFKLRIHRDHKDVEGYALVVAKNGPKLKPSTEDKGRGTAVFGSEPIRLEGTNSSMADLAHYLSLLIHLPVVDETGLGGRYDFNVQQFPGSPGRGFPSPLNGSALSALSGALDQLGLRLQAKKIPVPMLVIDQAEKPLEN
jgi:uncharacterized protein (TIGR03435 family)